MTNSYFNIYIHLIYFMKNRIIFSIIILITIIFSACDSEKSNKNTENNNLNTEIKETEKNPIHLEVSNPKSDKYIIGEVIEITFSVDNFNQKDTLNLLINKTKISDLQGKLKYTWDTKSAKTGTNTITVEYIKNNKLIQLQKKVVLLSDIKPKTYGYKVKNVYNHDIAAYTQGLFYSNGLLYEATGLEGESTVRKVKFETGEVLQSFAIPTDVFGEGITLMGNKIVQITWRSQRGFVYNLADFKLIEEFSYTGEGWGVTYDEKNLFMSNGSNKIQILENQTFSVVDEIEVYDDKGPVTYLNELEYIDGEIYANIYQYEKIARIDPKTGKVLSYIDLSHILPMSDYQSDTDVLNGIAYDKIKKRLFVTGKKWPKLFEIELL